MTPVIQQSVRFRTSPQALFDLYLDSRRHSLSTGAPATISRKVGREFKAFEVQLEGKNLLIVAGRQIVQLWRATHWKKADWSILILSFAAPSQAAPKSTSSTLASPRTTTRVSAKAGRNTIGARGRNTSANPSRTSHQDTPSKLAKNPNSVIPDGVCGVRNSAPSHVFRAMNPFRVSYLPAANELYNLQLVAVSHPRLFPLYLCQDLQVVFDRHASHIQPQLIQQLSHGSARRRLTDFPVHLNHNSVGHGLLTTHTVGTFGFARNANRKCPSPSCFTARIASAASPPPICGISNSIFAWPDSPASAA
jgi:hypothetical protein